MNEDDQDSGGVIADKIETAIKEAISAGRYELAIGIYLGATITLRPEAEEHKAEAARFFTQLGRIEAQQSQKLMLKLIPLAGFTVEDLKNAQS